MTDFAVPTPGGRLPRPVTYHVMFFSVVLVQGGRRRTRLARHESFVRRTRRTDAQDKRRTLLPLGAGRVPTRSVLTTVTVGL